MQITTYNNINTNFTYEKIYSHFNKFWVNEVISRKEYTRIWLTIIVSTRNNKTYKLINGLPFNTNNNKGILIVLKRNLNQKYFFNRKDILDNIIFKYSLDKYDYLPKQFIISSPSIFNSFKSWLFNYNKIEKKLAKDFYTANYFTSYLKENISSVHHNNLKQKMKEQSDISNKNNYRIKSFNRRKH